MKNSITHILLLALISLISHPAVAQTKLEIPLSNPGQSGKLIISSNFSDVIEVRTHDKTNVVVDYDGDNGDEEEDLYKDGMRRISGGGSGIEVTEDNNEVRIHTGPLPNDDLELVIYVPINFSLKLNTIQGDIKVDGLEGEVNISTVNGDVEVLNISGSVLVNSVNGDMEISFLKVAEDDDMSFTGVNGDIEIVLPAEAKFTAKMKTEWGDIYTNFDMEVDRTGSAPEVNEKDGEYKVAINRWIMGTVNGGGAKFLVKTLHGDISIRKK